MNPDSTKPTTSTSTSDALDRAHYTIRDKEMVSGYCQKLDVSQNIERLAHYLFEKVKTKNNNEREALRENQYYALCSIFIASRINYKPNAQKQDEYTDIMQNIEKFDLSVNGLSIDQIRRIDTSLELVEFLEMLNSMIALFKLEDSELFTQLKIVQKKLIILDCVYTEFRDYFSDHYVTGDNYPFQTLKSSCWMLFLLLGYEPEVKSTDFESMYQLLQALLLFLWEHVPQDLKIVSADSASIFKLFGIKSESVNSSLIDVPKRLVTQLMESKALSGETIGDNFLKLAELEETFARKYLTVSNPIDFDGRLFDTINSINTPIGSSKMLLSAPVYQLNPQKIRDFIEQNPELRSPLRSPRSTFYQPKSVMHATLHSIQLLSVKVGAQNDGPDAELQHFFKSCDTDQTEAITNRLQKLIDIIAPALQLNEEKQNIRASMIKKIYYQVLKDMLIGERNRLQKSNFTALLSNEDFHKSHVVCSVEAVLFAYNMKDTLEFEDILRLIQLEPFGLSVVIESFVNHASWLNSTFRRHFRSIEEKLLDSLVWASDSFYEKIKQHTEKEEVPLPHPGTVTPMAKKKQRVFNVYDQANQQEQNQQKNSIAVQLFFRKVYQLVSQRITDLCKEFNQKGEPVDVISSDIMKQIWHIVWYVLNSRHSLMRNRHIDHMIMCAMYAVCNKVNKMNWISFKDTIQNYRTICETNRNISPVEAGKIFGQVLLDGTRTGDIVKFYNNIFIPEVKDFILQSSPKAGTNIYLPDMPQATSTLQSPQRQRVSKSANVFISPMRSPSSKHNPLRSPMAHSNANVLTLTPRTKALYSFREGCTEKLIGHDSVDRSVKRALSFTDTESEGSLEPSSKFRKLRGPRRQIDFGPMSTDEADTAPESTTTQSDDETNAQSE